MDDTVAVIGALGGLLTVVIGALGTWALRLYSKRLDTMLAMEKLRAGIEKSGQSRTIRELEELVEQQGKDRIDDRELVHGLRNDVNTLSLKLAVCETKLKTCEEDKMELRGQMLEMVAEMRKQGLFVPPLPADKLSPPRSP